MDIEQEQGEAGDASPPNPAGPAISPHQLARRQFTRAGIGASGILLTLVSQPGMASEVCASPSSSMSGGLQSRHGQLPACTGMKAAYYQDSGSASDSTPDTTPQSANGQSRGVQSASAKSGSMHSAAGWPSQVSPSTAFGAVFACSGINASTFGQSTLGTIVNHASFDTSNLGVYMVATYLNIVSGRIGFLTAAQLQAIWYDWQSYGYYSPAAGVRWDAGRIVAYLSSTMA